MLKGFSIGIRAPRIVRDTKAANGRIIDGQIVEISLVDRPANPNAKLMLAKSDTAGALKQVEEFIEKEQDRDDAGRFGSGDGGSSSERGGSDSKDPDSAERDRMESARDNDLVANTASDVSSLSDEANNLRSELEREFDGQGAEAADRAIESLNSAHDALEEAKNSDNLGTHSGQLEDASRDLQFAQRELDSIDSDDAGDLADEVGTALEQVESYLDELYGRDKSARITTTKERAMARTKKVTKSMHEDEADAKKASKEELMKEYEEAKANYAAAGEALASSKAMCKEAGCEIDDEEKEYGESAEEETAEGSKPEAASEEVAEAEGKKPLDKADTGDCDCVGCAACAEKGGCDKEVCKGHEETKSVKKCLECGCNAPADAHGRKDVSTATMISPTDTPKSLETIVPLTDVDTKEGADTGTDEDSSDDEDLSNKTITAIIEKAVKSAKEAITNEVVSYQEEINKLNAELATAKNKAVQGGPKRSVIKPAVIAQLGDLLQKAAEYRAKSAVTEDKDLARGYKELASDFEAKALAVQASK